MEQVNCLNQKSVVLTLLTVRISVLQVRPALEEVLAV